jgi:hypothetical protein
MADVSVSVMIDGKQAYVSGAVGALDACDHAVRSLTLARDHFASLAAPKLGMQAGAGSLSQSGGAQSGLMGNQLNPATKPQDTSI